MFKKICKKLFKNNVPFHLHSKEYFGEHKTCEATAIWASYETNMIHEPIKLGISNYKDLMNKVKPLIYYIASKYQNTRKWTKKYEISFLVTVFYSNNNHVIVLGDYKLSTYPTETAINITEQKIFYFLENEKLINDPFYISVMTHADYFTNLYKKICDELFKNNKPFYSLRNEHIDQYNSGLCTILDTFYRTRYIFKPERLGIRYG